MSRRKVVALVSAAVLLALCMLAVALVVGVTQTGTGQDYIRHIVQDQLQPQLRGKLYVGRISGGFLDGVTIDSVELRGPDDSLVVASGPVRVWYDVRDLIDKRVLLKRVEVDRPVVHFTQDEGGEWNYKQLLVPHPPSGPSRGPRFGDFIVADSVALRGGSYILTLPWHPADSLHGARRDSAVRVALARTDAEIRRRTGGFARTYRWTGVQLALSRMSLAEPDSQAKAFAIADLDVDESDPPFRWRNVRGDVRILHDSIAAVVRHWDLAGSTGTATATITWGDVVRRYIRDSTAGIPTVYDVHVVGDSVSLADVAWVYPTLPRTGHGTMRLRIHNDSSNLHVLQYSLSRMDVHTTKSHVTGDMTFAVGGPVLAVRDVALGASPVDFDLLRTFNGKDFPYDFQGTLTGTVRGRGGPVNRFVVDDAQMTFADAHVPGATSRFSGRGQLDILFPAFTVFRGFDLTVDRLDLRSPQALNKNFPRLNGTVDGRVRLDSSWLDVRVSNADVYHRDGPTPPSHLTGAGRVTIGDQFLTYDLALQAQPLSLTTLARSYPMLPARGLVAGPMRLQGTIDDLDVHTTLSGAAGTLAFDGRVDAFEPTYGLRGHGTVTALDLRALLGGESAEPNTLAARTPPTSLTFAFDADARGSAPADLAGRLGVDLERSRFGEVRLHGGTARLAFADGGVRVDSLDVETTALHLTAQGGLGLAPSAFDSLRLAITLDSLGGLRRYLAALPDDSLAGALRLTGTLRGSIDTSAASRGLAADARVRGEGLVVRGTSIGALDGGVQATDLLRAPWLAASLGADSIALGTLALRHAEATFVGDSAASRAAAAVIAATTSAPVRPVLPNVRPAPADVVAVTALTAVTPMRAAATGRFAMRAEIDAGGPSLAVAGHSAVAVDSTRVVLDSARLALAPDHGFRLVAPAHVALATGATGATTLDTLALRDELGARMSLTGALRDTGAVHGELALTGVALGDLARLAGAAGGARGPDSVSGRLTARATLAGTRAEPLMSLAALATPVRAAGVSVDSLAVRGRYATRRLAADVTLFRGGAPLLSTVATLPVDLALVPMEHRQLGDTLHGTLRTDSLDLALLGALIPGVQNVAGRVRASAELRGSWEHPLLFGALHLTGGAASIAPGGVRLQSIAADVALAGDTLRINRVALRSGGPADTAALTGSVRFTPLKNPLLDLRLVAHNFLAVDRPRFATLWLTTPTPITLTGPYLGATVRGAVRAEKGRIYIPELIEKRIVDLSEYRDVVDTSALATRSLLPGAPSAFVENLTVEDVSVGVGDDVWLRSPDANIKLGGTLAVTRARTTGDNGRAQLALRGALAVERGTYRLSLPPIAQPIFEVQPGTLRFFGTPDLNPTLDIRAIHTVRQAGRGVSNRPDVRVQVTIGGTLNSPSLSLASPDDPSIATTDLISYLVTGEPAAVLLGQQQGGSGAEQAVALGLRLVGSYASGALSAGGPFDVVQVETASSSDPTSNSILNSGRSILERTRFGVGGQLGENTFYSFSAGLCGLGLVTGQNDFRLFRRGIGFRVEHRLTPTLSLQVGFEPSSQTQACNASFASSVLQTPTQGGFDFLRSWSF